MSDNGDAFAEHERVSALRDLGILDTASEVRFDRYAEIAKHALGTDAAVISFIDEDRQWFKAMAGIEIAARETPRELSFCSHAVLGDEPMLVVPDAPNHPVFSDHPAVTGGYGVGAYAGAVIHGPGGHRLGTICAFSHEPRQFVDRELRLLQLLAQGVAEELRLREVIASFDSSSDHGVYDPVTGLIERNSFESSLDSLCRTLIGGSRILIVGLTNIHGFRHVNQRHDRLFGDQVLEAVARRLVGELPDRATAGHWRDDRLAFFKAVSPEEAEGLFDRHRKLLAQLSKPYEVNGESVHLDFSMGVAQIPAADAPGPSELFDCANLALRRAQRLGSGLEIYSEEMHQQVVKRGDIIDRLRRAIEHDAIDIALQPIYSLADQRIVGCEALARWKDEQLGPVSPGEFIPAAEDAGLVIPLGRNVLRKVCREAMSWPAEIREQMKVGVNLAADELIAEEFPEFLASVLEETGLPGHCLRLEITETVVISDIAMARLNMERVAMLGVSFAIDDFGTGHSTLTYLQALPISCVKIDMVFVAQIEQDINSRQIATAIRSLADGLELSTVAEGIETVAQEDILRELGVDCGQGFMFSRPLPPEAFRTFVIRNPGTPRAALDK